MIFASACTNELALEVELLAPVRPDPFVEVSTVRFSALVLGEVVVLGEARWDQGPIELPTLAAPEAERFFVEGLSRDGAVVSSGASLPLDLLSSPPEGRLPIVFTRIGELSLLAGQGEARIGARAVELPGGRVLIAGGTNAGGAELESTELLDTAGSSPGPKFPGGRRGDFAALPLADGRVAVAGGEGDRRLAVLDPAAPEAIFSTAEIGELRPNAAYAVVSESLLIVAGGEDGAAASDALLRFNPKTLEPSTPGNLVDVRADSSAVLVSAGRVLMLGGRAGSGDDSAKRDALIFDPTRGAASLRSVDLGGGWVAPVARVTAAGSAIVTGGRNSLGNPTTRVSAVVAQPDRAQAFGDTSTVTALAAATEAGQLLDLDDGSLLFLPEDRADSIQYIGLSPSSAEIVDVLEDISGPFIGGRVADGTVRLRSEEGNYLLYNPGLAGVLGAFSPDLPIIPLRPAAWSVEGGPVRGRLLPGLPQGGLLPAELAVLGSTELLDFELSFLLELAPLSQAAIAFSFSTGDYDHVSFLGNIAVAGRIERDTQLSLGCASAETPSLADGVAHRITIARRKSELRVEVDGDGVDNLVCQTPDPRLGRIALGVITGSATFSEIKLRRVF